uniref:Putative secreted protein n=1 Tax=Xenopsylla cheopis TaxID=163159 RepID=A0A6M2DY70_XENCH
MDCWFGFHFLLLEICLRVGNTAQAVDSNCRNSSKFSFVSPIFARYGQSIALIRLIKRSMLGPMILFQKCGHI